jgi:hypothetical protein
MRTIGEKVRIGSKSGVITQVFPGDDITTYEVTYRDGSFSIEAIEDQVKTTKTRYQYVDVDTDAMGNCYSDADPGL